MIKFLEKLPPLNLWNWPKQPDIEFNQQVIIEEENWLMWLSIEESKVMKKIDIHEKQIKEKKWLYYLRTGRVIE